MQLSVVRHTTAFCVLAAVAISTAGCAGAVVYRAPSPAPRLEDYAYRTGVRDGRAHGARDAIANRSFDYTRHDEYRRAARSGRDWGDGASYRRGFVAGYEESYRENARDVRRDGQRGRRDRDGSDAYSPRGSRAGITGYRDGYNQGLDDARDGRRHDPIRARQYRDGDNGYDRRDGSLESYKRIYRTAFTDGYDAGYRDGRRR